MKSASGAVPWRIALIRLDAPRIAFVGWCGLHAPILNAIVVPESATATTLCFAALAAGALRRR